MQYGWPIGMPLCRNLKKGLWEVRSDLSDGRIARLFFFFTDGVLVVVHGIIKKTQKKPKKDLELARERKTEFV